jgi:hypothetical protein
MDISLVFVSPELLAEMSESESPSPEDLLIDMEDALEENPYLTFEDIFDSGGVHYDY